MQNSGTLDLLWLMTMVLMIPTFILTGDRIFLEISIAGSMGFAIGRRSQI